MSVLPQLLIFDLDGTLVDSFPGLQVATNLALGEWGLPEIDLEWIRRHIGCGSLRLAEAAADGRVDVEQLHEAMLKHYAATMVANTRPFEGVDDALAALAPHFVMAVASNKPLVRSRELVAALGWGDLMEAVVGPETAGSHKPDPAMILSVLEATGLEAGEALLIGDMPIDAETGRNAGIDVVGVATGSVSREELSDAGCIEVMDSVRGLPEVLLRTGSRTLEARRFPANPPTWPGGDLQA